MHHTNYRKRRRFTFFDDYFDEKRGRKGHIIVIRKSFINDCSPGDTAIPFAYSCVY